MDKKKLKMLLGSIFVFLIFLSAYAAFGSPAGNNFGNQTNKTKTNVQTLLVSGEVNAVIINYTDTVNISVNNSKDNYSTLVKNTLNNYEINNYIINYYNNSKGNNFEVLLQNMSAYSLQQKLNNLTNNNIICNSTAVLLLPNQATLYYGKQPVNIFIPNKTTARVVLSPLLPINANLTVHINAFVTKQGQLYNNQISVSTI